MSRGFGVASGLDPKIATPLAARCAELGYGSIWSNDTPFAEGLETLAAFAEGSAELELGVTIAIDRHPAEDIAARVEELALPAERLWVAVGAGVGPKPLTTMREHLPRLREALPRVRLALAAMGPKMCVFGGAEFDGVFLNWMTPDFAAETRQHVERGAAEAGREVPPVLGYVRTAVGDDAGARLAKEEAFYRDLHDGYRSHFDRLDAPEGTVGVATADATTAKAELAEYTALDVLVVRGLASAKLEAMTALAEAAAP
jgi:alkanesulfonate monooxygenase SsuD/methylene tetrahydromethanopterin reductase-like flavin-dependent oxidoreductase (luciferase family)